MKITEKYIEVDTTSNLNNRANHYEEEQESSTLSQYSTIDITNLTINIKYTERSFLVDIVYKFLKRKKTNSRVGVQELFKSNVDKSTMTTTSDLTKNIKNCKSREMIM